MIIGLDKCMIMVRWISRHSWVVRGRVRRSAECPPVEDLLGSHLLLCSPRVGTLAGMDRRAEVVSEWTQDMKASDYSSLKEKVVSLEQGLQAIGAAQVGVGIRLHR